MVLSRAAEIEFRMTDYYAPEHERTLLWKDPEIGIAWPDCGAAALTVSDKDHRGVAFGDADLFA